jgi:ribonuclease Y
VERIMLLGEGVHPALIVVFVVAAALAGAFVIKFLDRLRKKDVETEAKAILDRAEREVENRRKEIDLQLKEKEIQQRAEGEKDLNEIRQELHERERKLDKRQDVLDQQTDQLRKQESMVENNQRKLAEQIANTRKRNEDLDQLIVDQRNKLHDLSGLSRDEAKDQLLSALNNELQQESGAVILKHEKQVTERCEERTREILITALQRYAAPHTAGTTTSTVDIPSDEMKGRIIGREGRNIRAFEKATGVDVIIDDTPGVVIVSAFDTVRREIARLSLAKLIADGRIHPSRIEEIVKETEAEMEQVIRKTGEEAAQEAEVPGLNEKIIQLLGRLKFRTSYSQNVLRHSIEVAFLAGMMAEEIGMNGNLARRCGLLHDIGKAADHEAEGGHPKIGADILKRLGEGREVVHAALGHHDDLHISNPYTVLVAAADACSASRPGARRETLERYVKRMEELESIATSFPGVSQAFAIQAGREVRVMASAKDTDDEKAAKICRDIARAFEEKLTFPGEIKVTVVRETRFVEVAK